MKRDITIRALLQRQRHLHPVRTIRASDAVLATAVRRRLKGSSRIGLASAADRRATWRATVDRMTTRPR